MEPYKLQVKIGAFEFSAEGEKEMVDRQFEAWSRLVSATPQPVTPAVLPSPPPVNSPTLNPVAPVAPEGGSGTTYQKVFAAEGPVVTLRIVPTGPSAVSDAALVLLLGYKELLGEDQVTGGRVLQGLGRTGLTAPRADRVFVDHMTHNVIRSGSHRATRYRLTIQGLAAAQAIAKKLEEMVP